VCSLNRETSTGSLDGLFGIYGSKDTLFSFLLMEEKRIASVAMRITQRQLRGSQDKSGRTNAL